MRVLVRLDGGSDVFQFWCLGGMTPIEFLNNLIRRQPDLSSIGSDECTREKLTWEHFEIAELDAV